MGEIVAIGASKYLCRLAIKPVTELKNWIRYITPEEQVLGEDANELAVMLSIAYDYSESKNEDKCITDWKDRGYEVIPPTEFSDEDVKELLKCTSRPVVALRRPQDDGSDDILVLLRGSCVKKIEDLVEDFKFLCETLHKSDRVRVTKKLVKELVDTHGSRRIRLAGHSLGAGIGFIIARELYLEDPQKTPVGHFFNLPFMCIETLYRNLLHVFDGEFAVFNGVLNVLQLRSMFEDLLHRMNKLTIKVSGCQETAKERANEFGRLINWMPYIYVNGYDRFSNGYIPFFRDNSRGGGRGIDSTDTMGMSRCTAILGILGLDPRADHLCPSGNLIISWKGISTLTGSHSIQNWMDVNAKSIRVESYTNFVRVNN